MTYDDWKKLDEATNGAAAAYVNGLNRYLILMGFTASELSIEPSPDPVPDVIIDSQERKDG